MLIPGIPLPEKPQKECSLTVGRLRDIWLSKIVFEGILVKTDPGNRKAHANKRLIM